MRTLVIASLLALSFTTGFTCSKNAPEAQQPAAQEQMAAPAAAPAAPADANAAAPAAPADANAAAPAAPAAPADAAAPATK